MEMMNIKKIEYLGALKRDILQKWRCMRMPDEMGSACDDEKKKKEAKKKTVHRYSLDMSMAGGLS